MGVFIPDDILQATRMSEEELKRELAILLFQKEKLTLGQASRQIPVHYDVAEFEEDLKALQELGCR